MRSIDASAVKHNSAAGGRGMKLCPMLRLATQRSAERCGSAETIREACAVRTGSMRVAFAFALMTALIAGAGRADDYPSRPIRLIVPYAAGGAADSVARIIAKRVPESV